MSYPIYVVDAFSASAFSGNPAGVCVLETDQPTEWMQQVAAEMKHAETAFVRPVGDAYVLRWLTPTVEVDLCGHATLATAHTLWESGRHPKNKTISFHTRSGILTAELDGQIQLNFPSIPSQSAALPHKMVGLPAIWTGHNGMDWFIEVDDENALRNYHPDFDEINRLGMRGLIVTAKGSDKYDFVSRFFAPQSGVPEDPVTGSAHCCLAPYWAAKLGKSEMLGYQASERGGEVGVVVSGDRILLRGNATTILEGTLRC